MVSAATSAMPATIQSSLGIPFRRGELSIDADLSELRRTLRGAHDSRLRGRPSATLAPVRLYTPGCRAVTCIPRMAMLDWYGLGALVLIALVFYFVRKIPMYIALCGVICVGFVATTAPGADFSRPSEWIVMTLGLLSSSFGLLIVRVMLIRSISLNLLRNLDNTGQST